MLFSLGACAKSKGRKNKVKKFCDAVSSAASEMLSEAYSASNNGSISIRGGRAAPHTADKILLFNSETVGGVNSPLTIPPVSEVEKCGSQR